MSQSVRHLNFCVDGKTENNLFMIPLLDNINLTTVISYLQKHISMFSARVLVLILNVKRLNPLK